MIRQWIALFVVASTAFYGGHVATAQMRMPTPGGDSPVPIDPMPSVVPPAVGRSFLSPPELPPAPAGVEELLNSPSGDEDHTGLTLELFLSLAAQHNPTLQQAQQQVNGTLGKALEAGLWPNPTIFYVAEQIFVDSNTNTDTPGEFQGASIQQEIVTANKRKLSRDKYLARAKSAEWLAVAQQWKVCNDVRIHFWKALAHQQVVEIRRELLKSAEDEAVTVREQFNLGQATRVQVHHSNVALQRARLELLAAENMYRSEFGVLTSLAGSELPPQTLMGNLEAGSEELLDYDTVLGRIYADSPEILAARAKWQADCITVQREKVEPIPNIFVQVGSGYNFESGEPVASAQIFLDIPIFDRNQGTIRQAQADLARQSSEIRRIELRLRQDLSQRYQPYLTALQHVMEYQSSILPEARQAYAEQLDAYKNDRQNWGDVLNTQRQYFKLREQYLEQLSMWRTNEVLINGYLLHGGLDAAPSPTPPGHIDAVAQPR